MTNDNTMSIEDVIKTIDVQYQLSSYLKLRGHISFKAARLTGMYMAKMAKIITDHKAETGIDNFNAAMGYLRGQSSEDELMHEMGMEAQDDLLETIRALVMYSNKLNFDMQELVDPTGKLSLDPTWKFQGVFFDETQREASWKSSVKLIAEGDTKDKLSETYEEYSKTVADPKWLLTEEEWTKLDSNDNELYDTYQDHIVERLMDIGPDECDFDELPIRAQIAAIENMRGKIPSIIDSAMKSLKYARNVDNKKAEGSKLKGLINGFNPLFCSMLDSSRYANFTEFMYGYIPTRPGNEPVTRRMIARRERAEVKTFMEGKRSDEEMTTHNDDFLELESDVV